MSESVLIRPALESDLPEIAEIHIRAFPESFLSLLGRGSVERYYAWLLDGPHQTSAFTARHDGKLSGFCFGGLFRGALSGFLRKNKRYLLFSLILRPVVFFHPEVWSKLGQGLKILKTSPSRGNSKVLKSASFGILSVAVDPDSQGLGIGRQLMVESEKAAKELGFSEMDLTVHPENKKAVLFYENLGWFSNEEKPWKGRMRKKLQ